MLPEMLGLARTRAGGHSATWTGAEGTVTISAHGHGLYTEVIASTDRLRTSRMDVEVQKFPQSFSPTNPVIGGGRARVSYRGPFRTDTQLKAGMESFEELGLGPEVVGGPGRRGNGDWRDTAFRRRRSPVVRRGGALVLGAGPGAGTMVAVGRPPAGPDPCR